MRFVIADRIQDNSFFAEYTMQLHSRLLRGKCLCTNWLWFMDSPIESWNVSWWTKTDSETVDCYVLLVFHNRSQSHCVVSDQIRRNSTSVSFTLMLLLLILLVDGSCFFPLASTNLNLLPALTRYDLSNAHDVYTLCLLLQFSVVRRLLFTLDDICQNLFEFSTETSLPVSFSYTLVIHIDQPSLFRHRSY